VEMCYCKICAMLPTKGSSTYAKHTHTRERKRREHNELIEWRYKKWVHTYTTISSRPRGELWTKFGSYWSRNVNLYKVQTHTLTHTQTLSFIHKMTCLKFIVNISHSLNSMMLTLYSSQERTEIVFFFCGYCTHQRWDVRLNVWRIQL
jgi:hypothetical protein